jgi:hypothetical protein
VSTQQEEASRFEAHTRFDEAVSDSPSREDSVYDQTQDGEKHNPWGDGVKGQAMFDSLCPLRASASRTYAAHVPIGRKFLTVFTAESGIAA